MNRKKLLVTAIMAVQTTLYAGGDITPNEEPNISVPDPREDAIDSNNNINLYVGLGFSAVSTREDSLDFFDGTSGQDKTIDLSLSLGYEFNKYIAVEGRYMFSIAEEDIIDRKSWGIYVKPQYPITESFNVYGLLGYGGVDISGKNNEKMKINIDETGFQWGLGTSYEIVDNLFVSIDYLKIATGVDTSVFVNQNVDIDSDAITLGIQYHF